MTEEGEYFFPIKEEDICQACKDCLKANVCSYYPQIEKCWKERVEDLCDAIHNEAMI